MRKISLLKIGLALALLGLLAMSCGKGSSGGSDEEPTPVNPGGDPGGNGGNGGNGGGNGGNGGNGNGGNEDNGNGGNGGNGGTTTETTYKLTFDSNGASGSIADISFKEKETATIPDASTLTYENHVFIGWNTDKNATTSQYDPGSSYTGKTATLYAIWTEKYKITYHYDPKEPDTKQSVEFTGVDFSKGDIKVQYQVQIADNQILTWKDAAGNTYEDGSKLPKAANLEVWAEITNKVTEGASSEEWQYKEYFN